MNFFNRTVRLLAFAALTFGLVAHAADSARAIIAKAALAETPTQRIETITSLIGSGDESIAGLLAAWKEDALFVYTAPDGSKIPVQLSGDKDDKDSQIATRVDSGKPLLSSDGKSLRLVASTLTAVEHTSALRRAMKAVLDLLDLSTPDLKKRISAIQTLGFAQDSEKLAALQARQKIEPVPSAQRALREAIALIGLKDASAEVKLASLRELTALHTIGSADALKAALADAEARYNKALADLRITFEKTSTDVLKGMTPDVTKEVASQVSPLIAQISAALGNYRQTMQQSLASQGDALTQVREQMKSISETTAALATSTTDFTSVLKSSQHRGKWGEQTLRNVVEAAGLSPHCDFAEQVSQDDARPDLIVKLPGDRCIIIDSKVPEFDVAIADQGAPNRRELVAAHAAKLRKTIRDLAAKDYPAAMEKQSVTPFDKVVLFLPAESLLSTALEGDNDLIMAAGREGILIATPATLISFLGAINLTWQQHVQAENAGRIATEATELYDRLMKFTEHFAKVRKGLLAASEGLDAAIGSYESRIRPQGERVRELGGAASREALPEIAPANAHIRRLEGSAE